MTKKRQHAKKEFEESVKDDFAPCTPNWQGMFELAERITGEQIPDDQGQGFVLEMLQFGKRLEAARHIDVEKCREAILSAN